MAEEEEDEDAGADLALLKPAPLAEVCDHQHAVCLVHPPHPLAVPVGGGRERGVLHSSRIEG